MQITIIMNTGDHPLFCIPLSDILAVERLQEDSFKKKNMFQIVQPNGRALYVQVCQKFDYIVKECAKFLWMYSG